MAEVPGPEGPVGAKPPKWIHGVQGVTGTDTTDGAQPADSLTTLGAFGQALGYWLPDGLNRATTASRRMLRSVG